jgi:hypothetical protein
MISGSECVHVGYFAVIIINQSGLMENKMKPKAAADEAGILAMCEREHESRA